MAKIIAKRRAENDKRLVKSPYIFATATGSTYKQFPRLACKIDCVMAGRVVTARSDRKSAPFAWNFHSFRATGLHILEGDEETPRKASIAVQERMLDHALPGGRLRRHYIKTENFKEIREAFEALSAEIIAICEPSGERKVA